ncbi:MAG: DNA polymerase III subunit alpha [Myxococcota bacterium]|nr:DNA polymerase III subunit alpha [Myxococcota bacterium]
MAFVHLHNRTQYSLLDGAMSPKQLIGQAEKFEMPAVSVTDTCNLYCGVELYKSAKKSPVHAVYGSEIWLWPDGLETIDPSKPDGGFSLVFLIEDRTGYKNLCQLITTAIFDGMHYRPRIDLALLKKHREGLIVMTSGLNGPIGRSMLGREDEREQTARAELTRLVEIIGQENLYVEMQDYGIPRQLDANILSRKLAGELGLRTVVTNDCRYIKNTDAVTLDLLNCISRGTLVDDPNRAMLPSDQQYFKSEAEMREIFPDDGPALDITVEIAERCHFQYKMAPPYFFPATNPPDKDPEPPPDLPADAKKPRADTAANWEYFYKAYPPPANFQMPDPDKDGFVPPHPDGAGSMAGYFEWYCAEGLRRKLPDLDEALHEEYWKLLDYEMGVILQMGFPAYMLIVAEFINWSKDNGIPIGPGRGSAAGSLVAWVMRITDIDPIRYGLIFERFLNPERVSMPDIDIDFCQDRREEAIEHVRVKYGRELVSQIITYGKLQAKAALKDVARVLGVEFQSADHIAKQVPPVLGIKLKDALLEEKFAALADGDPLVGRVSKLALRVEGMTRQTGVHAAGVVIADRPLVEHAPLYRDGPEGGPVVQYDMKSAESIGLIKFDFLGLKTLDQIRDAVIMIHRNTGELIDMGKVDVEDEATYKLLQKGDSLGVFQVESSGMRELLTRLLPNNIDDLIALLALYRPGPLSSGMVDNFIDCKHGRKKIEYPHPDLEPILKNTYGSIVYQEQVMQTAQVMGGYSLGGADLLRRAMGKKKVEVMVEQKIIFVDGAVKKGYDKGLAGDVFDLLAYFAGYGFNRAHSAAYGVVSYQTAWLKAHHRAEYMGALMSIESNNTDKVLAYIGDCKRAGIKVLPPNVNESYKAFNVPKNDRRIIRFGLSGVKGVGDGAVAAIIEAREADGDEFKDFMDCLERLDLKRVNKKVLENLIKCGAFDWTDNNRRQMLKGLPGAITTAQKIQDDRTAGQTSLFGLMPAAVAPPTLTLPDVGEWPTAQKLSHERDALGLFITGHPLEAFQDIVPTVTTCPVLSLENEGADRNVTVAGMVSAFRVIKTKRGSKMAFATIEDATGAVECVFFSDPYTRSARVLTSGQPILAHGKLEKKADGVKILAENAELLAEVRERRTRQVDLLLDADELSSERITELKTLLQGSQGRCPVHIHLRYPGKGQATIKLPDTLKVIPDEILMQGLESLFRRSDVPQLR